MESEFSWLDTDPCYLALGISDIDRAERYREFVQSAIPAGEWELIERRCNEGS